MRTLRSLLALATVALAALPCEAQIIRPGQVTKAPLLWVSASAGRLQQQGFVDGSTRTAWEFGSALQYRASIERPFGRGNVLGLAGTIANAPLRYSGAASCDRCEAHARVTQALVVFRGGQSGDGRPGIHQVIEFSAGVIGYSQFRRDADDLVLPPAKTDYDPTLAIGYGLGYAFSPRLQAVLVQEASTSLHQKEGLQRGEGRTSQQFTTRLGVRFGLAPR